MIHRKRRPGTLAPLLPLKNQHNEAVSPEHIWRSPQPTLLVFLRHLG